MSDWHNLCLFFYCFSLSDVLIFAQLFALFSLSSPTCFPFFRLWTKRLSRYGRYALLFCRIQVRNVGFVISCERGRRSVRVRRRSKLSVRCFQYGSKDTLLDKAAYVFFA